MRNVLAGIFCTMILAVSEYAVSQPLPYTPTQIGSKKESKDSTQYQHAPSHPKHQAPSPLPTVPNSSNPENSGALNKENGTEFWPPLNGFRFKVTDSLLVLFTAVLAVFTGLLWFSTNKLWKETQITSNTAKKSAQAAEKAAIAAERTVETMETTARRELRAYVGIDDIRLKCKNLNTIQYAPHQMAPGTMIGDDLLCITFKNYGNTTAKTVRFNGKWASMKYPLELAKNEWESIPENSWPFVIFPGQTNESLIVLNDLTEFRKAITKEVIVYVFGRIEYFDIYEIDQRTTSFCYIYSPERPDGLQFVPY